MLDVAVYLYTAGYHLLDPRDTQYGRKVTCHFLIIPTVDYIFFLLTRTERDSRIDNISYYKLSSSALRYLERRLWYTRWEYMRKCELNEVGSCIH